MVYVFAIGLAIAAVCLFVIGAAALIVFLLNIGRLPYLQLKPEDWVGFSMPLLLYDKPGLLTEQGIAIRQKARIALRIAVPSLALSALAWLVALSIAG